MTTAENEQGVERRPSETHFHTSRDPQPEVHVHNSIKLDSSRVWSVLITLMVSLAIACFGYQLSLGPLREVVATGLSMFLMTLVTLAFKAGILRLPEKQNDDLAFTKSTIRRIYDEIQAAIANSSMPRLLVFAAGQTAGFLILRAGVAFAFGLMSSLWMAAGFGLLFGAAVLAQEQIWAWIRTLHNSKRGK
ncbi:hypothetical protein GCM10027416_11330 [Okibacterium endophyticum]